MSVHWLIFAAIITAGAGPSASARMPVTDASVQDGGMCWVPDVEFPVPCGDEDED